MSVHSPPPNAPPPVTGGVPSPVPGLSGLTVLARGGYSTVYRARQDSVGREVALKIDTRPLDDERDRRRFLREAEAAGRMSGHPHVVKVFDAGVTGDNYPYLVMELCTGGSYSGRLKTYGPLPPAEVRDVGVRIADALHAAHQAGILHRDVKPANILINAYGVAGLADFGLAALPDPSRELSVTIEALTPAYAPPEVFRMERPSPLGDVYSLAASMYALLAGRPPRWPDTGSPSLATMVQILDEPVPDIPGVPVGLTNVIRRAMATEPAHRYPNAAEFRDALGAASLDPATAAPAGAVPAVPPPAGGPSSGGPVSGQPWSPAYASPGAFAAPGGPSVPPTSGGGNPGRRTLLVLAGVAALVVLLLGGGATGIYLATTPTDPSPPPQTAPTSAARPSAPTPSSALPPLLPSGQLLGNACELAAQSASLAGIQARCPERPECWGSVSGGAAQRRSCTSRHSWETYVIGTLSPSTSAGDPQSVRDDPGVRALCTRQILQLIALQAGQPTEGWQVTVLGPVRRDGDNEERREFRCVAGNGPDSSDKPHFV